MRQKNKEKTLRVLVTEEHKVQPPRKHPFLLFAAGVCSAALLWGVAGGRLASDDDPQNAASLASTLPSASVATAPSAELTDSEPTPPQISYPASVSLRVGAGDTLLTILTDTGVTYEEAHEAVEALRKIYDPKKLDVGQQVAIDLDASKDNPEIPYISSLSLPVSKTTVVKLIRGNGGAFDAQKIEAPVYKTVVKASGAINSSFYQTGMALGIPANTLNDLIKVYSYDVDFQRDIKRGNRLEALVERLETQEGDVVGYGKVLYASLKLDKRTLPVYRYADKYGNVDYYNEKGESLRKALLRTPINGARITSGYGLRRHPILGYSKMHRGVDFGAVTGTPIYAAGDGVVAMAGPKGAYGNYVQIKHDGKYSTAYAHASRIAKGIRPGVKVKQGQVIAYVGSTGRSTGPHLHYEILAGGKQVNPSGVKFKTGQALAGKELAAFKGQIAQVKLALAEAEKKGDLAMADTKTDVKSLADLEPSAR